MNKVLTKSTIIPQAQEDRVATKEMLEALVNPFAKKMDVQVAFDGNDAIRQTLHALGYKTFSMTDMKHMLIYAACAAGGAITAALSIAAAMPSMLW